MAADRGAYIDQSQSFNAHMAELDYGKLTSMHFYGWKKVRNLELNVLLLTFVDIEHLIHACVLYTGSSENCACVVNK